MRRKQEELPSRREFRPSARPPSTEAFEYKWMQVVGYFGTPTLAGMGISPMLSHNGQTPPIAGAYILFIRLFAGDQVTISIK